MEILQKLLKFSFEKDTTLACLHCRQNLQYGMFLFILTKVTNRAQDEANLLNNQRRSEDETNLSNNQSHLITTIYKVIFSLHLTCLKC